MAWCKSWMVWCKSGWPDAGLGMVWFRSLDGRMVWCKEPRWCPAVAGRKIYYCRLVTLGLWETFHNKRSGNIIPRRLVGTLSVIAFQSSHKICGNTLHNLPSGTKPKLALWLLFSLWRKIFPIYNENLICSFKTQFHSRLNTFNPKLKLARFLAWLKIWQVLAWG